MQARVNASPDAVFKALADPTRRALFELGRAYAANQQTKDAIAAYRKAADKGSSAAMGVIHGEIVVAKFFARKGPSG